MQLGRDEKGSTRACTDIVCKESRQVFINLDTWHVRKAGMHSYILTGGMSGKQARTRRFRHLASQETRQAFIHIDRWHVRKAGKY